MGNPFFWHPSENGRPNTYSRKELPGEFFGEGGGNTYFDGMTTIGDMDLQPGDVILCGIVDHDASTGIVGGAPGVLGGNINADRVLQGGQDAAEAFGAAFRSVA